MSIRSALFGTAVLFPLIACSEPPPEWVSEAQAKSVQLGSQLITALNEALADEGPIAAVEVCNLQAPKIAARLSGAKYQVGRTALRVRNPANAPDEWERSVMQRFETRMKQGADPADLEAWTVEPASDDSSAGARVGRYMKAIPTGPRCVVCHGGGNIAPALNETLQQLYPEDQATGFEPGDLRGAFSVTAELRATD